MKIEELINKIEQELKKGLEEQEDAEGLLKLQETVLRYEGEYKLVWSKDLLEELKTRPEPEKYNTEIEKLDDATGGFRPQQLITLAAHTKHGKTTFGLFLLERLEKLNPVFIPLEQSAEEIILQRKDNNYSIPNFLSPHRVAPQVTVDWIEYRVIEGIAKYNTKFVMIDNLDWIDKGDGRETLAYRIGEVMRGLKAIAQRWNVIIILQAHIHQADEEKIPVLRDIKNSSDIAQNSDMVIMLWRENTTVQNEKEYTNNTMLSIQANRRTGKNVNIKFIFDDKEGIFNESEWLASYTAMSEKDKEVLGEK